MAPTAGKAKSIEAPTLLDAELSLAETRLSEGRLTEAEAHCRRALAVREDLPQAEHVLGVVAYQKGKINDAIVHVRRAVHLAPTVALYHANLGEMLRLIGEPGRAAEEAQCALAIDPNMTAALSNLGAALYDLGKYEEAAVAQRRAIAVKPDFAEAHSNLGNALHALRRFDEAIESYRWAVELKPDYADAWANLGTTLHHSGRFAEGAAALRRAIALSPGHANARAGLGILLLMRGEFGEGWDEYEWRLRSSENRGRHFPERAWQGESLAGKSIYVQAEQGLGDTLQFVRYLPWLAARGAKVALRAQQPLVTLLRESLSAVAVLGERGNPPPYEYDVALLSLPRLAKTRLESVPAVIPYLRSPAEAMLRWRRRLSEMAGLKVGIAWAGSPDHANDRRRSVSVSVLTPLLSIRGASFASLQVGPRAADVATLEDPSTITNISSEIRDFADTAAAIAALDLTIAVDTAVAHLAGALGKPVWLLLPWVSDWRWMLGREDSPWYPSMRLFRQNAGEDWRAVISRVAAELDAVAKGDARALTPFKAEGERRAAHAAAIISAEAASAEAPSAAGAGSLAAGQALLLAEQKRARGFLADAEELARQAAASEPDNAEAWHALGIVAHQSGNTGEAIAHIQRAIAIAGNVALYHANLAETLRLAGRLDEAIAVGRRALEISPRYPEALNNLGIALFDKRDFEAALGCYERAISLKDDFAQAHSNRGNALQRLKRFAEAEPAYRRAIELQPTFPDAWNNLGTCLRELKRVEEAEAVYRQALALAPNNPQALDNLALALGDLQRFDEAAALLRKAIDIEENDVKLYLHYSAALLDQRRLAEATAAAERALAVDPKSPECINQMGRVAFERGDLLGALGYYRCALDLNPDLADAHNNMGNVLKELGRLPEAESAYLDSIRLDPEIAGVYVNLADLRKFSRGDPLIVAIESLAAKQESLSTTDRLQLDFALGKVHADLRDYDRSFRHLIKANAAKRAMVAYNEASTFALFDRIEAVFSRELISAKSGGGHPATTPVFVIGMPRSGSTLIEQIIASHPQAQGAGELQALNDVVLAARSDNAPYPEIIETMDQDEPRRIGADYLLRLREAAPAAERVTDKMPSNYYFVGLIHLALPNAPIIHCRRDPIDTCLSCFTKLFSAEQNHTYDLSELGRYYRRYERLMDHWRRVLPAGRILDVRYEDVVADLEGESRRILAHCGLEWHARCLAFHETDRPVRTASAAQVRQPIYRNAVGRWRDYAKHLAPLFAALGVEASPQVSSHSN
jgi:tetratricopeptide (TPR) repeat protein